MKFPWDKYEEVETTKRNTLQVFLTNKCNLRCDGCFARNVISGDDKHISMEEYHRVMCEFIDKGGEKINLLGGEPLLHPEVKRFLKLNKLRGLKTTVYTNGSWLRRWEERDFYGAKVRVSIYNTHPAKHKTITDLEIVDYPIEFCYMVSKETEAVELLRAAEYITNNYSCRTFFISSIRELDNDRKEFFDDTNMSMPVIKYKELVHDFLNEYGGNMEIHISKRGVFESTKNLPVSKCKFVNYFIGGKIIQCPYDIVNLKYQIGYNFDKRSCQQNNTCLMSKIVVKRRM